MKKFELKYGCNPHQKQAEICMRQGELPFEILNGRPGYINFLDAMNAWQLVRELKDALKLPAAASFKHVSPSGAALGLPMSVELKRACFVDDVEGLEDSPLAQAYARARGVDRMSSFGDFIALSDTCDAVTARLIRREVSDGIIAPDYTEEALEILRQKRKGSYTVIRMDSAYEPPEMEEKEVFGIVFRQTRNNVRITEDVLKEIPTRIKEMPADARRDLIVSLITLKYTQSNSVCFASQGQAIGVGAGQQSRIHCTRLAGGKADNWHLRQSEQVLALPFREDLGRPERDNVIDAYINGNEEDVCAPENWPRYFRVCPERFTPQEQRAYLSAIRGVSLGSDAFFPFSDNIERAWRSGVDYVAEPGGSIRDDLVIQACDQHDMVLALTGLRLFHH